MAVTQSTSPPSGRGDSWQDLVYKMTAVADTITDVIEVTRISILQGGTGSGQITFQDQAANEILQTASLANAATLDLPCQNQQLNGFKYSANSITTPTGVAIYVWARKFVGP